jgi:hypothetical protein
MLITGYSDAKNRSHHGVPLPLLITSLLYSKVKFINF